MKRVGPQSCDSCGREFIVRRIGHEQVADWKCPWCGFNNKVGEEIAKHAQQVATQKSVEARKLAQGDA